MIPSAIRLLEVFCVDEVTSRTYQEIIILVIQIKNTKLGKLLNLLSPHLPDGISNSIHYNFLTAIPLSAKILKGHYPLLLEVERG